jgi:hypothetical protein
VKNIDKGELKGDLLNVSGDKNEEVKKDEKERPSDDEEEVYQDAS